MAEEDEKRPRGVVEPWHATEQHNHHRWLAHLRRSCASCLLRRGRRIKWGGGGPSMRLPLPRGSAIGATCRLRSARRSGRPTRASTTTTSDSPTAGTSTMPGCRFRRRHRRGRSWMRRYGAVSGTSPRRCGSTTSTGIASSGTISSRGSTPRVAAPPAMTTSSRGSATTLPSSPPP
jgi:hypothetical protein